MKEPKCSFCKEVGHYKINCFNAPRTQIKSNPKELKRTPLRRTATKMSIYPSKPAKPLRKPLNRRKQLIKELDGIFSKYIRMSSSVDGVARCVTCGIKDSWKLMDNGHFLSRGKIGVRFDERNCHVQCRKCNRIDKGNIKQYTTFMQIRYGTKIIEELRAKATQKIPTYELEAMVIYYKEKVLNLS